MNKQEIIEVSNKYMDEEFIEDYGMKYLDENDSMIEMAIQIGTMMRLDWSNPEKNKDLVDCIVAAYKHLSEEYGVLVPAYREVLSTTKEKDFLGRDYDGRWIRDCEFGYSYLEIMKEQILIKTGE